MISMGDLKEFMNSPKNKTDLRISKDYKRIVDINGNDYGPSGDLLESVQKDNHCWFECIFSEHVSLTTVYRCKECGTVIFTGDDERWEPALRCPTCSDYKPRARYYTKKEIESDPEKKKEVDSYIAFQHDLDERARRREIRGLEDWEIWKKKKFFKKWGFQITLGRMNLWGDPLKGLHLEIDIYKKEDPSNICYTGTKYIKIPLSPYAFYIQFIIRHTKRYKKMQERLGR